jgi:hypothetical protein
LFDRVWLAYNLSGRTSLAISQADSILGEPTTPIWETSIFRLQLENAGSHC